MSARYVIDASILVEYAVSDTYTAHVKGFFVSLDKSDEIWIPEYCLLECANVLWKEVVFHSVLESDAQMLLAEFNALPLKIVPLAELLPQALHIGIAHKLAIYDAVYVALAEKLNCPMITADNKQQQAASATGIMLKPITDFSPSNP